MNTDLLDVNVFIALLWPAHEYHDSAHRWFRSRGRAKWASCPMTQLGVVRLLSNPTFSPDALSVDQASTLVKRNFAHPSHEFWPDSLMAPQALATFVRHLEGYRQTTDAYLLGLAIRKKGRVATFDSGLQQLAAMAGQGSHVELIPSTSS